MSNSDKLNDDGSASFPEISSFSGKAQNARVQSFQIERVMTKESLLEEWEPLLVEIFPDENDRESPEDLLERFEDGENFFLMRNAEGQAIGMELSQVLLEQGAESSAMYVPWTGVTEPYRNNGIGSQMNRTIADHMREKYGVTYTIIDIEDPARLQDAAYSDEELPEAIHNAERRINFWRREGFLVIDDETKETGDKFEYCRPASIDESEIQAYDHMCVRLDDEDLRAEVLSADGTMIDKAFIRQSYLDITQMQYGALSEEELRAEYPAVDQYLEDIDAHPEPYLPFRASVITPKQTPNALISMTLHDETFAGLGADGQSCHVT